MKFNAIVHLDAHERVEKRGKKKQFNYGSFRAFDSLSLSVFSVSGEARKRAMHGRSEIHKNFFFDILSFNVSYIVQD